MGHPFRHNRISIPFSTIKRISNLRQFYRKMSFQFHLVRLKGRMQELPRPFFPISIPFSTIKSQHKGVFPVLLLQFQFHLVRLKASSIGLVCPAFLFQFHLVRLKGRRFLSGYRIFRISIPFSTIKSSLKKTSSDISLKFQFHLVRLKESATVDALERANVFQFHLVRLKACGTRFISSG